MTRNGRTPIHIGVRGTLRSDESRFIFFMHFVYILYSKKCDRYYIGFCSDIDERLRRHNLGMVTATKNCRPYEIKATKAFPTMRDARKEELRLKKQKSRKYLEWIINGNW